MNSLFGRFRTAAVVCGIALVLAGCNAVEDVREKPSTPVPAKQQVIKGTITGLGYRRPLVLEDTGEKRCTDPTNTTGPKIYCKANFFGNFNEAVSQFSFGSLKLGTPYNITIKTQPYGKICTITGTPSGVASADVDVNIGVNCVTDTGIPRYCVGGTIDPAIRNIQGLRITLSTEEGLTVLSDDPAANADGPLPVSAQSCWFPNSIFNSGSSLPIFRWYVTATYPGTDGKLANCRVLGGAANTGSNDLGDNTITSSTNVTDVSIPACNFTIGGNVGYSQPAGVTYTAQTIAGLVLSLRDTTNNLAKDINGSDAIYQVPSLTPAAPVLPATPTASTNTTAFTLGGATPLRFYSNSSALYDVQIATQPTTGQFCIVAATATTIPVTPTASSTVYPAGAQITGGASARLVTPNLPLTSSSTVVASATFSDLTNLAVRCRAHPGTAANPSAALAGSYQLTTTARTVITGGTSTGPSDNSTVTKTRNFLTFFPNGSFLYGTRSGGSGVERGFYNYNATTGTITFTVITDTNNTYANLVPLTATQTGISALPSLPSLPSFPSLTSVLKTAGNPSRITALASTTTTTNTTAGTTTVTTTWQLDEPTETLGRMHGTWATDDSRRVFIYDPNTTFGSHVGVAGAVNFGDACYFLYQLDGTPSYQITEGYYARRGTSANGTGSTSGGSETSTGCPIASTTALPGQTAPVSATLDYYAPALSQLPGYIWRLPGSQSGFDGRSPSPNYFTLTPGAGSTPDSLTIYASDQGTPLPATTVTFLRTRSN